MPVSYYSVVQYLPDPIRLEAINIGVVVFDELHAKWRFLERWDRVSAFAVGDVGFLRNDVVPYLTELGSKEVLSLLERQSPIYSVQLSPRCASILPLETLLPHTAARYLVERCGRTN